MRLHQKLCYNTGGLRNCGARLYIILYSITDQIHLPGVFLLSDF